MLWSLRWSLGAFAVTTATFAPTIVASGFRHDDRYEVHTISKAYDALLGRRDGSCQGGWSACAAGFNGGCCPGSYACETSYCYATTAGPSTACGRLGYYNCPIENGPGSCCPVGYICGNKQCDPPAGVSYSMSCPASYFQCPASLDGGCCKSGMLCGKGVCVETTPSTYPISFAITTTDAGGNTITSTITTTTVITPTVASASLGDPGAVAKLVPSTVSKLPFTETTSIVGGSGSGGGSGLTQAQLGGIIGGIIGLLVAIVVAAIFIVFRLRKTARIVEESKQSSADVKPSSKTGFAPPTTTEVDVDPLSLIPSSQFARQQNESMSSFERYQSSQRNSQSPSGTSTPPAWGNQYNMVPNTDLDNNQGVRHTSMDSAPSGYYDPARASQQSSTMNRISYDSQPGHGPGPRWSISNTSEVMGSADGAHGVSELEGQDPQAGRRLSGGATRPPLAHTRRSSDGQQQQHGRSESFGTANQLGTVTEIAELHGFYGSGNRNVGQTTTHSTSPTESQGPRNPT